MPVLSTTEITDITNTTATSGGIITDDKGFTVTSRGVCWSTNENPSIRDNKTENGAGGGSFISSINDLKPGTRYYVRSYATNSKGTGYGMAMSFTTNYDPILTTKEITEITHTTATSGGNITDDGGGYITARGGLSGVKVKSHPSAIVKQMMVRVWVVLQAKLLTWIQTLLIMLEHMLLIA